MILGQFKRVLGPTDGKIGQISAKMPAKIPAKMKKIGPKLSKVHTG